MISIGDNQLKDDDVFRAKVISFIVGVFFIVMFFYWFLIFSCTFLKGCPRLPTEYNNFLFYIIWLLLFLTMIALLFTLLTQLLDDNKNLKYYFTCGKNTNTTTTESPTSSEDYCLNFIVIWALTAIIMYAICHLVAFIFIATKTIMGYYRRQQ